MSDCPWSVVRGQLPKQINKGYGAQQAATDNWQGREFRMTEHENPKRSRLFWRLWLRALTVKRAQTGVALVSLLLGAATVSMLANLYDGVGRKMTQEFRTYGANVVVAPASGPADVESPAASSGLMDEEVVLRRLQTFRDRLPGLIAVPRLDVVTRIAPVRGESRAPEPVNAVAVGADFVPLLRLNTGWQLFNSTRSLDSGACAVGEHVASRLRVAVGDAISMEPIWQDGRQEARREQAPGRAGNHASERTSNQSAQVFRVSNVLRTGAAEDDQVFLSLPALQRLVGLEAHGDWRGQESTGGRISLVELSVPGESAQVERVVGELSSALASPSADGLDSIEVRPVRQIVYAEGKVLGTIRGLVIWLASLIVVIIALCLVATMTAVVLERRKDIAVMKALGASDRLVMRLLLAEGAGLGLLGGLAGVLVGGLLAREVGWRLFRVGLGPDWWTLPVVCLASMTLSALATFFPVGIVRGIQPAAVLKGE